MVDLGQRLADGTPYALRNLGGIEPVQLSVQFYSDLFGDRGEGYPCLTSFDTANDGQGGETGTVLCSDSNRDGEITNADRARWAIVVLWSGLDTDFELSWS